MSRTAWLFPLLLLCACARESTGPVDAPPPGVVSLAATPTFSCLATQAGAANYDVVISWNHYPLTKIEIVLDLGATTLVTYARSRKKGRVTATTDEIPGVRISNGSTVVAQGGCNVG